MSLTHLLGRAFFLVSYPLYYRRKLRRTDHCRVLGFSLTVAPGVFHPGLFFSTKILGEYLLHLDLKGKKLLEIGIGSGVLSMLATQRGASVTGIDVSPVAVECARVNIIRNGIEGRIEVFQSDLFENVPKDEMYDCILWNPPFFPKEPADEPGQAWGAGEDYRIIQRFARDCAGHLSGSGRIILILTDNKSDVRKILGLFSEVGLSPAVTRKKRSFFEVFSIVEIGRR